jgi:hypothetical protein
MLLEDVNVRCDYVHKENLIASKLQDKYRIVGEAGRGSFG